jgi:hypothetical protein
MTCVHLPTGNRDVCPEERMPLRKIRGVPPTQGQRSVDAQDCSTPLWRVLRSSAAIAFSSWSLWAVYSRSGESARPILNAARNSPEPRHILNQGGAPQQGCCRARQAERQITKLGPMACSGHPPIGKGVPVLVEVRDSANPPFCAQLFSPERGGGRRAAP